MIKLTNAKSLPVQSFHVFYIYFESREAHLLVQGNVINPDSSLSGEVVGAVVAVLQHGPAVWGVWWGVTRVSWTPKPEEIAGSTQTL